MAPEDVYEDVSRCEGEATGSRAVSSWGRTSATRGGVHTPGTLVVMGWQTVVYQRVAWVCRQGRPAGLVSRDYLCLGVTPEVATHRRALLRRGGGWRGAAMVPVQLWLSARWLNGGRDMVLNGVATEPMDRFAVATGVAAPVQRRRLDVLVRRHSVPVGDVYRLGLLRDGWQGRWAEFAYDVEVGWNAAASGCGAMRHVRTLSNKPAMAAVLTQSGIATVPSIQVARRAEGRTEATAQGAARGLAGGAPDVERVPSMAGTPRRGGPDPVAAMVDAWLSRWPVVHVKRSQGSRGEGACEIHREGGAVVLREYQTARPVNDPMQWLSTELAVTDHLVQPRLVTHATFAAVADPSDVVTCRIVTRDVGNGPEVFSCCLEVPLPPTPGSAEGQDDDRQFYLLMRIDEDGKVVGSAVPPWLKSVESQDAVSVPEAMDALTASRSSAAGRISRESVLIGLRVPDFNRLTAYCLRAHKQLPGLFAVAWDVAVAEGGNVFLEGNAGFGTVVPQWLGGGLLAGLPARRR
ncbi:MAG: hypothetical protein QG597_3609 [Actinomycetota bacterium]|nr:hypothetical protein [Actinomycetota bacterium]